jgi:hypothetical protein
VKNTVDLINGTNKKYKNLDALKKAIKNKDPNLFDDGGHQMVYINDSGDDATG